MKQFIKRFTRLIRNVRHKRDRKPLEMECIMDSCGLQPVLRIDSQLPAVIFLACGHWRTRCANLTTAEGLPVESRLDCIELDNSLRHLWGDSVGG